MDSGDEVQCAVPTVSERSRERGEPNKPKLMKTRGGVLPKPKVRKKKGR